MSMENVSSRRGPPFTAERWSGDFTRRDCRLRELIVNGSGNTDFRLPWDLRIVTEVMRSECRGDFYITGTEFPVI